MKMRGYSEAKRLCYIMLALENIQATFTAVLPLRMHDLIWPNPSKCHVMLNICWARKGSAKCLMLNLTDLSLPV